MGGFSFVLIHIAILVPITQERWISMIPISQTCLSRKMYLIV